MVGGDVGAVVVGGTLVVVVVVGGIRTSCCLVAANPTISGWVVEVVVVVKLKSVVVDCVSLDPAMSSKGEGSHAQDGNNTATKKMNTLVALFIR